MNQRIDFTLPDGLGVTQDTLDFMQVSYRSAISAISMAFGNYVILHGVQVSGGNVTPGWVIINGELLPFVGGVFNAQVKTSEIIGDELFEDLTLKPVYYTKAAQSVPSGGFPFTDLVRLSSIKDLTLSVFKPGMITMWSGSVGAIPAGFGLCDGTLGTPDLRGRFIVGYDPADPDYAAIGSPAGAKSITLELANLPAINLQIGNSFNGPASFPDNMMPGRGKANPNNIPIKSGAAQAFENRPPYYVLAYIIKLPNP